MKILLGLFSLLPASAASTLAAAPSSNAAPATPAPAAVSPTPSPAPVPAPSAPVFKLDDYINDLATTLKLSDDEKKAIRGDYQADGNLLKNILNNDALTPLQKAQQISDLRDVRNTKIEALLHDFVRQQDFLKIEARYRVALTELAEDGGLAPTPSPTPTPAAPTPSTNSSSAAK